MLHTDPETRLAALIDEHGERSFWYHRKPVATAAAVRLIRQLPPINYEPGSGAAAEVLSSELTRTKWGLSTPLQRVVLTRQLVGPAAAELNRTSRKKVRRALRDGVTWHLVEDRAERVALLAAASEQERVHPDEEYRNGDPDLDHLLGLDLWIEAHHQGRPVLLAVVAVDGECALLSYFRTLVFSEAASNARYLMSEVAADQARLRGATKMCVTDNPLRMPHGLLHFARSVGFRMLRISHHH